MVRVIIVEKRRHIEESKLCKHNCERARMSTHRTYVLLSYRGDFAVKEGRRCSPTQPKDCPGGSAPVTFTVTRKRFSQI